MSQKHDCITAAANVHECTHSMSIIALSRTHIYDGGSKACTGRNCQHISKAWSLSKVALQEKSKDLKASVLRAEEEAKAADAARDKAVMPIGNLVHDSVPISNDEVGLAQG